MVVVALALTVVKVQFNTPLVEVDTDGVVVFWVTDTKPVVLQPVVVFVTV